MNINDILEKVRKGETLSADEMTYLKEENQLDEKALADLIDKTASEKAETGVAALVAEMKTAFESFSEAHREAVAAGTKEDSSERDVKTAQFLADVKAKAMNAGTDTDGGYMVPQDLLDEIVSLKGYQYGVFRSLFRNIPVLRGNGVKFATGGALSVTWVDEGAGITSDQAGIGLVTASLKKLAVIVPMTSEIDEDSVAGLTEFVAKEVRRAMGREEDAQYFAGDGTVFTGIFNHTGAGKYATVDIAGTGAAITAADLHTLYNTADEAVREDGVMIMNPTVMQAILTEREGSEGAYLNGAILTEDRRLRGTNARIVLSDQAPTLASATADGNPLVWFGDPESAAVYVEKRDIRFKMLDQATITDTDGSTTINLAEQDMVALRAIHRTGMAPALASAAKVLVRN